MTPEWIVPVRLSPPDLLLGRVPGLCALWKRDREHPTRGAATARDLLAVWAGLQRLVVPSEQREGFDRLDGLVRTGEARPFFQAVASYRFDLNEWQEELRRLEEEWDLAGGDTEQLERRTRQAFEALDRTGLFLW